MSDVKRLLDEATPRPWIRPWATLEVHAPGQDDLFGVWVAPDAINRPDEALRAQRNLDLAVAAVNRLADLEALREVTEQLVVAADPYRRQFLAEKAEDILRRLKEGVPASSRALSCSHGRPLNGYCGACYADAEEST